MSWSRNQAGAARVSSGWWSAAGDAGIAAKSVVGCVGRGSAGAAAGSVAEAALLVAMPARAGAAGAVAVLPAGGAIGLGFTVPAAVGAIGVSGVGIGAVAVGRCCRRRQVTVTIRMTTRSTISNAMVVLSPK